MRHADDRSTACDTNNTTPALGLYLSVGFTPTLVLGGWHRTLPVN